jgi:hypothetical protein
MKNFPPQEHVFLLRVWLLNSELRISLENMMGGERVGFSKLEALVEFLRNNTISASRTEEEDFASPSGFLF